MAKAWLIESGSHTGQNAGSIPSNHQQKQELVQLLSFSGFTSHVKFFARKEGRKHLYETIETLGFVRWTDGLLPILCDKGTRKCYWYLQHIMHNYEITDITFVAVNETVYFGHTASDKCN